MATYAQEELIQLEAQLKQSVEEHNTSREKLESERARLNEESADAMIQLRATMNMIDVLRRWCEIYN